ncbi:MAG: DUF4190 domain-containing protein [Lachnospiraceae bacterium]|nr:DUF4190 domain-containing protein [Lachnospiraceae bacterium]
MQDDWKANVKAIVSLVLACLSIVCCCAWYLSLILGVAAVVFGVLGYRDENPNQEDAAIAGIVVGAVGLALAVTVAAIRIMVYSAIL